MATKEGSRPLLVEVQALVDQSHMGNPRRLSVGLESQRLAMLLAVLHRHAELQRIIKMYLSMSLAVYESQKPVQI